MTVIALASYVRALLSSCSGHASDRCSDCLLCMVCTYGANWEEDYTQASIYAQELSQSSLSFRHNPLLSTFCLNRTVKVIVGNGHGIAKGTSPVQHAFAPVRPRRLCHTNSQAQYTGQKACSFHPWLGRNTRTHLA